MKFINKFRDILFFFFYTALATNVLANPPYCPSVAIANTPDRDCKKCFYSNKYMTQIGCLNSKGQKISSIHTAHIVSIPNHKSDSPQYHCNVSGPYDIRHGSVAEFTNVVGDGMYKGSYDKLNTIWTDVTFSSQAADSYTNLVVCKVGLNEVTVAFDLGCIFVTAGTPAAIACIAGLHAAGYIGSDICNWALRSEKSCGETM